MGRRDYKPADIDPAILPLVDVLNELEHIETVVSCEGHPDKWWSSTTPAITFFVRCRTTDDGDHLFPAAALSQFSALTWLLERTFHDGVQMIPDRQHRRMEPLASVVVMGEQPGADHEETPRWWTPVAFVLKLQSKDAIPLVMKALQDNWADLRDRRGAAPYDAEEQG